MKYIITKKQYNFILEQQYGDIISLGGDSTSSQGGYGDIITFGKPKAAATTTTGQTTSNPNEFIIYSDVRQSRSVGKYTLRNMRETTSKNYEVDLVSFKMSTTCDKLKAGDYGFNYLGGNYYSKDLARKVGLKFNCKLKE